MPLQIKYYKKEAGRKKKGYLGKIKGTKKNVRIVKNGIFELD